jgi:hypothetical protein
MSAEGGHFSEMMQAVVLSNEFRDRDKTRNERYRGTRAPNEYVAMRREPEW